MRSDGLRAWIKCASAPRVIPLVAAQSQTLQDDFACRVITCQGCGWRRNKKTLGPTAFTHRGEKRLVCWYVLPDIAKFDDAAVDLVQEYALIHEALV